MIKQLKHRLAQLGLLAAGLAFSGAAFAQSVPVNEADPSRFAAQAIERFQLALPEAKFAQQSVDPLEIKISEDPEWDGMTINLHRLYSYCQSVEAKVCLDEQERLVIALTAKIDDPKASDLRIIVRDANYWSYANRQLGKSGEKTIHRRIGDDLYAILALDSPQIIRVAVSGDLEDFELAEDAAWQRAAEQTGLVVPPLPLNRDLSEGLVAFGGEEYTGSMLLFLPQWQQIAERAGPDLAVSITSDQLVVAGVMPEGESLIEFKQLVAEDCASVPRCISPYVYRFREGRWVIAD